MRTKQSIFIVTDLDGNLQRMGSGKTSWVRRGDAVRAILNDQEYRLLAYWNETTDEALDKGKLVLINYEWCIKDTEVRRFKNRKLAAKYFVDTHFKIHEITKEKLDALVNKQMGDSQSTG